MNGITFGNPNNKRIQQTTLAKKTPIVVGREKKGKLNVSHCCTGLLGGLVCRLRLPTLFACWK